MHCEIYQVWYCSLVLLLLSPESSGVHQASPLNATNQFLESSQDTSLMAQTVKSPLSAGGLNLIPESGRSPGEGNGNPLQYSCWKIPWMEEPGGLQSMGSLRVGHDWATSLSLLTFMHWRRKWQPTPVFLPGESQGRGSLVGCRLWGRTESDTTEST